MVDVNGWAAALAWALVGVGVMVLLHRQRSRRHRPEDPLRALRSIQGTAPASRPAAPGTYRRRP